MIDAIDDSYTADEAKKRKLPVCADCKHLHPKCATCEAFPNGIPDVIYLYGNKHTKPLKGDNGIRFEPVR